jgi:hypothetical protein
MCDHAAAIRRKHTKLLHGAPKLLPLWRAETLDRFIPLNQTAALLRRHIVELVQPITQMLLRLRRKLAEPGFVFQRTLLLRGRQIAVTIHPLFKMFRFLSPRPVSPLVLERVHRPQPETTVHALSRESRRGSRKDENCHQWLKHAPEFD